jgi:DNA ligase-4
LKNKKAIYRFDIKSRFRIIDTIDRRGILKKDILYFNRYDYFERILFVKFISEFDVGFEYRRQFQSAELFKRLFSVKLMGAGFDKPVNTRYFALRFSRMLKIHDDRSFKDTVSFEELQEMARRCREAPEESEREETYWLGRLGRSDYLVERSRSSSLSNDSPASVTEATGFDSQIARQQEKANTGTGKRKIDSSGVRSH